MKLSNKIKFGLITFLLTSYDLLAQSPGARDRIQKGKTGLETATRGIQDYFEPAVDLIYVITAIIGLIGAVKVYGKFSKGDPDTGTVAAQWFGAILFVVVAVTVIKAVLL